MSSKQSAWVWIVSGIALLIYGGFILSDTKVPGITTLVAFIDSLEGAYIYGSSFLIALIEGIYVIGNFFPGGTLVVIAVLLSQAGGVSLFVLTILGVFLGWTIATFINVYIATAYRDKLAQALQDDEEYQEQKIKDRLWLTWYPSFRANHEVEHVVKGVPPRTVLWHSIKMKFYISIVMSAISLLIPLIIDLNTVDDGEGVALLVVIALISISVGAYKLHTKETIAYDKNQRHIAFIPGWANSTQYHGDYTPIDIWNEKIAFDTNITQPYIVGHSLGSLFALQLWQSNQHAKLILLSPMVPRRSFWTWVKQLAKSVIKEPVHHMFARIPLYLNIVHYLPLTLRLMKLDPIAMLKKMDPNKYTVVFGEDDEAFFDNNAKQALEQNNIPVTIIKGAAHMWSPKFKEYLDSL